MTFIIQLELPRQKDASFHQHSADAAKGNNSCWYVNYLLYPCIKK